MNIKYLCVAELFARTHRQIYHPHAPKMLAAHVPPISPENNIMEYPSFLGLITL